MIPAQAGKLVGGVGERPPAGGLAIAPQVGLADPDLQRRRPAGDRYVRDLRHWWSWPTGESEPRPLRSATVQIFGAIQTSHPH